MSRRPVGVALALLSGMAGAAQSRVNGELGLRLHDGMAAAVISFGSGLLVLAVLVPLLPSGRRGLHRVAVALRHGELRWWHCLGGICGGLFVASQGLTVPALGVALFTVALVAGQSGSGLALDRVGLGPGGPRPVTGIRVASAALAVVAVLVAVWPTLGSPAAAGLAVLPALAGAGQAWQQAVNGRVRQAAGHSLPTALINFVAGTAALALAYSMVLGVRGWTGGPLPAPLWLYSGGVLGIVFIGIAAHIVRFTGVLLLGLGMVSGQVIGAVLLDLVVPGPRGHPDPATYTGAALTLVAVLLAASPRPRLGR